MLEGCVAWPDDLAGLYRRKGYWPDTSIPDLFANLAAKDHTEDFDRYRHLRHTTMPDRGQPSSARLGSIRSSVIGVLARPCGNWRRASHRTTAFAASGRASSAKARVLALPLP